MKKKLERKQQQPLAKPRFVVPKNNMPYANWTPIAALVLAVLIGYLTYALCSRIPIVDYCSTGVWQYFG